MKILIFIGAMYFVFDYIAVNAQGFDRQDGWTIEPEEALTTQSGPTFSVEKNGLILSVSFPSTAKDIQSLIMTLKLVNETGSAVHIRSANRMIGFDFHIVDKSLKEMPVTTVFHNMREDDNHFMGVGVMSVTLNPNMAIVSTFPLKRYYSTALAFGTYLISADWANLKIESDGLVRSTPGIRVEGLVLIQSTHNGISISASN